MKKLKILQVSVILVLGISLGGIFVFTDVYQQVHAQIVSVICLSCIKLEPLSDSNFTFEIVQGFSHPQFILENLSRGPIFLHYSADQCHGCDVMLPIIQELFSLDFNKTDQIFKSIVFQNQTVLYFYTNIHHDPKDLGPLRSTYELDSDFKGAVPLFIIITLKYDRGIVKPYYISLYGELGLDTTIKKLSYLTDLMKQSIDLYNQNKQGFFP